MLLAVMRSSASHPAITDIIAATSYTLRAMGPGRSWVAPFGITPARLTMPCVATMPTALQLAEGCCTEALLSVPIASPAKYAAMAAPLPLLVNPGDRPG